MFFGILKSNTSLQLFWQRYRFALLCSFFWCLLMVSLYYHARSTNILHLEDHWLTQARTLTDFVLNTRQWNARHGGVYVRASAYGLPNPWLPQEQRSVYLQDGTEFVLINPAYMSRQLSENTASSEISFAITSPFPLRPDNMSDAWEKTAFSQSKQGIFEVYAYVHGKHTMAQEFTMEESSEMRFRYWKAILAKKSCLSCHKNKQEGEVLGGISVSLDTQSGFSVIAGQNRNFFLAYGLMAIMGSLAMGTMNFFYTRKELMKEAQEKLKDTFMAHMSHDMRTPLAGILGMTELLREPVTPQAQAKIVEYLQTASTSLLEMVTDITDYSAINAQRIHLQVKPFLLRPILEQCCALFIPSCVAKGLTLHCEVEDTVPQWLMGDSFRLRQILGNIINNAVKFTAKGGVTLHVKVSTGQGEFYGEGGAKLVGLYFIIIDTGCGIVKEDQTRIFSRFERGSSTNQSDIPGTGLGLAIVAELTQHMQGNIVLQSTVGQGTRFQLFLPFLTYKEEAGQEMHLTIPQVHGEKPQSKDKFSAHILLVEDNAVTAFFVRTVLEKAGCQVWHAAHGTQALEFFAHHSIDLVLMDMRMPGMDGLSVAHAMRTHVKEESEVSQHHVPIVFMSASVLDVAAHQLQRLRIQDVLLKPLTTQDILNCVAKYCVTDGIYMVQDEDKNEEGTAPKTCLWFNKEKALQALDDDAELLHTLVTLWLEEYPQRFFHVQRALQRQDVQALLEQAHTIKNSAAMLCCIPLYECAKTVENDCKNQIMGDGAALLQLHTYTYMQVKKWHEDAAWQKS